MTEAQLDRLSIDTIRTLSIDAVQRAKSGHPGTPMALAPLVYTHLESYDAASIPPIRFWPTAIGSCSRTVTRRCSCGRCCHLTGTLRV
jgi:hypothetical protein